MARFTDDQPGAVLLLGTLPNAWETLNLGVLHVLLVSSQYSPIEYLNSNERGKVSFPRTIMFSPNIVLAYSVASHH